MINKTLDLARHIAEKYKIKIVLTSGHTQQLKPIRYEYRYWWLTQPGNPNLRQQFDRMNEGDLSIFLSLLERWARMELEKAGYVFDRSETCNDWIVVKPRHIVPIARNKDYLHALLLAVWEIKETDDDK